jgi:hypothetical protein
MRLLTQGDEDETGTVMTKTMTVEKSSETKFDKQSLKFNFETFRRTQHDKIGNGKELLPRYQYEGMVL